MQTGHTTGISQFLFLLFSPSTFLSVQAGKFKLLEGKEARTRSCLASGLLIYRPLLQNLILLLLLKLLEKIKWYF